MGSWKRPVCTAHALTSGQYHVMAVLSFATGRGSQHVAIAYMDDLAVRYAEPVCDLGSSDQLVPYSSRIEP